MTFPRQPVSPRAMLAPGLMIVVALAIGLLVADGQGGLVAVALGIAALLAVATGLRARDPAPSDRPLAPLIALVGCDGSGKSTLSADVQRSLARSRPAKVCYLGLGTGELGNRIRRLPLIGRSSERALARKAGQARARDKTIPGLPTALVVFAFSLLRVRRFRRMLALRAQGVVVITDRYPQTEVPGFYDGPGLSAARAGSPAVAWLAAKERALYEWMASYHPDLVLRLNVDVETALARKPDHKAALLREKVRVTPLLRFHGARIVDLDARGRYDDVRAQVFEGVRSIVGPGLGGTRELA